MDLSVTFGESLQCLCINVSGLITMYCIISKLLGLMVVQGKFLLWERDTLSDILYK